MVWILEQHPKVFAQLSEKDTVTFNHFSTTIGSYFIAWGDEDSIPLENKRLRLIGKLKDYPDPHLRKVVGGLQNVRARKVD